MNGSRVKVGDLVRCHHGTPKSYIGIVMEIDKSSWKNRWRVWVLMPSVARPYPFLMKNTEVLSEGG